VERGAHEADPDDGLARAGRGRGADEVVGVGAGADHRGIADPAAPLARDAAGRGGGGDVTARVARHRADGLARSRPALAPAPARGVGHESLAGDDAEAVAPGERDDRPAEEDLAALRDDRARRPDRVRDAGHRGDRTGEEELTFHERRVELDPPLLGEDGAEAGVERGIVLEVGDRFDHRVERALAAFEHAPGALRRTRDAPPARRALLGRRLAPGSAVNGDRDLVAVHGATLPARAIGPKRRAGAAGGGRSAAAGATLTRRSRTAIHGATMKRAIDLEGCLNFRDLGGYPTEDGRRVRWRSVFRSDALHLLTEADLDRLRADLCVTDVVDLRSTAERRGDARRPLEELAGVRIHHAPLFDGEMSGSRDERARMEESLTTLADRYVGLAEYAKPAIARVLSLISD